MRTPHNRPVVTNHALISIAGRDAKGKHTEVWLTSSQPMDLMAELSRYRDTFPGLLTIAIVIDCFDEDRNKPIKFE